MREVISLIADIASILLLGLIIYIAISNWWDSR